MGHVVLQGDEHDGGERHHPQQCITIFRPRGEVARPVTGIDEAHSNQQTRADVLEDVEGTQHMWVRMALEFF